MREMLLQLQGILNEFPEYVIIGGVAATLLGAPRTTVDVDSVHLPESVLLPISRR
jgi:hypothetical protein